MMRPISKNDKKNTDNKVNWISLDKEADIKYNQTKDSDILYDAFFMGLLK